MKKYILLLLLATFGTQAQTLQNPTYGNVKLKNNTTDNSATKVNVQSTDGTINTISKSDLVNVVEVNDVPTLPLVGVADKIYVVKNVNKIYRWNGTFYQELAGSDISGLQAQIDLKENAFSKNTAFNKNFGTTAGTVVEGNDSRINNGQTAFGWGNHAGLYPSLTGAGANGTWGINISGNSQTSSALGEYNWNQTVKDNADFMFGRNSANEIAIISQLGVRNFLGLGSNAYNSTVIPTNTNQLTNGSGYITDISGKVDKVAGKSLISDSEITRLATVTNQDISGKFDKTGGTISGNVNVTGTVTATSLIKSASPATNILLAGGGDLAQGTAFNKNFGTTAGTVVEGGTLGSNAYSSTAYLPLSGGTVNGLVSFNATTGGVVSFQTNSLPSALMTSSQNITGGASSATDFNTYVYGNNPYNIWTNSIKRLEISGLGEFKINSLSGTGTRNVVADASGNLLTDSTVYAPLNSPALTGAPTAPTAPAGTNTTQIATTAFVQANSRPYKVYTALLTQSGTNAPVATVLENTLGGTVVWSYVSIGQYRGTLTGAFLSNKTVVFLTNVYGKYFLTGGRENDNSVMIGTQAPNGGSTNGDLSNSSIEIRVYL